MQLDDLIALTSTPNSADEMLNVMKSITMVDDIPEGEKAALATGFLIGLAYAVAKVQEPEGLPQAAKTLLELTIQWRNDGFM
jgi:hypothetical protein